MIDHKARMNGRKAVRAALEPGFAGVLPKGEDAKGFMNLNRRARRATIARTQAARNGKPRLKTHAANVQYWRGVEKFGVCPTRARPIDIQEYAAETDGAVEELANG